MIVLELLQFKFSNSKESQVKGVSVSRPKDRDSENHHAEQQEFTVLTQSGLTGPGTGDGGDEGAWLGDSTFIVSGHPL